VLPDLEGPVLAAFPLPWLPRALPPAAAAPATVMAPGPFAAGRPGRPGSGSAAGRPCPATAPRSASQRSGAGAGAGSGPSRHVTQGGGCTTGGGCTPSAPQGRVDGRQQQQGQLARDQALPRPAAAPAGWQRCEEPLLRAPRLSGWGSQPQGAPRPKTHMHAVGRVVGRVVGRAGGRAGGLGKGRAA
jgi:hypothetical protein